MTAPGFSLADPATWLHRCRIVGEKDLTGLVPGAGQ